MKQVTYVGMDVHRNWIVAVWKQPQGKERFSVVNNTPDGWEDLVRIVGEGPIVGAYEASGCGFTLHDWLTKRDWKVWVLAHTHLPQSARGRKTKTDLRDARKLLDVTMSHGELGTTLPSVWIPEAKTREDREIVRRRLSLAEHLTRVKNGITSMLEMHGIRRPAELKTLWTQKYVAWVGHVSTMSDVAAPVRKALASLLRELAFLGEEIERLDVEVKALAEEEGYRRSVHKMTELPGVGTLTAMTYLVELGDVRRFKNRQKVASYLGLVPSSYESGDANDRKGHITRMGPYRVRKVLNQAALAWLRLDEQRHGCYERIAKRRGKKKAIVAMMRRLGIELWHRALAA